MKKFLVAVVALSGGLLVVLVFERLVVEKTIGPSAIVAMAVLASAFLILLVTLLLYGTRYRGVLGNVWLAISSVTATYVAVDVIAGLILIRPLSPPLVPDEYRHHKLVPNSYSQFHQRDFQYTQRVNNLGLRGEDRSLQKPEDSYRILMLGDSFTMGKGVNDNQTFSAVLEVELQRQFAGCTGGSPEVLNAGVDSYTPILSYIQLSRELYSLKPDLVVLNLDVSDLIQEAAYRRLARYDADGELIGVPQPPPERVSLNERVRVWTERHLYLTRLLLFYINRLFDYRDLGVREVVTQASFELAAHTLAGDVEPRDKQWADIFDSILKLRSFAESNDMEFVLTAYPWGHQVNDAEWLPGRYNLIPKGAVASDVSINRIEGFAAEHGVRFANLFPIFRAYMGRDALYFRHDNHWTPAGHRIMASGLRAYLGETIQRAICDRRLRP